MHFGGQIEKYKKNLRVILYHTQFHAFWRFWSVFYIKTVRSRILQTFAAFLPKIVEHDVTKTPFSQKNYRRIFRKFW